MSVMAPCLSSGRFHTAWTFIPIEIFDGSTSPRLWSIPIPGLAPSISTTATRIGVLSRRASVPTWENKNSLTLVALPRNYFPILQLSEESANRHSCGPAILRFELVDDIQILTLLHLVRSNLATLVVRDFLRHSRSPRISSQ